MLLNFDSITVRLWVKKREFHIWQRWARAINLIGHHLCYGFSLDRERILRSQHIVSLCARSWLVEEFTSPRLFVGRPTGLKRYKIYLFRGL